MHHVGILSAFSAQVSQASSQAAVLMSELQRAGYEVGRNLRLDAAYAEGDLKRLPQVAADLVSRGPQVILASGNDAIAAARAATRKVPIVMAFAIEPVGNGLVDSLARPGGNVTGATWLSGEIAGKAMEVLHQAVPSIKHLAALGNPATAGAQSYIDAFSAAASRLGVSSRTFSVYHPDEVDAALAAIAKSPAQALYMSAETATEPRVADIAAFALRQKLPTISLGPRLVEAGGLLYYGPDVNETIGRVVGFMDRILRGAQPGDLPIEQPSRFELVVNANTARALGLALHGSFLMRATRVIG
ncbi:MAG TPA: ABC transporter substrate-binding protein [Burkholderiaceae bacterium]|nr:ABC transporter substrate-binding protein [Burkholderiaceae bacterium]